MPCSPPLVACVDGIGYHIFTVEHQASNLWDALALDRQQNDMTVGFQHRIRRLMINPLYPLLFFLAQRAHVHFAGSTHLRSSLRGDFAPYSMTFPACVSTFYLAPAGTQVSTRSKSNWRLTARGDHRARLRT